MQHSVRGRKGEKDRAGFWSRWRCQTPGNQKEPAMSRVHLILEERIGIKVFVAMEGVAEKSPRILTQSHTSLCRKPRQGSPKSGYCAWAADGLARKRRKTPRHYRCMSRSDLVAGANCGAYSPGLSKGPNHAHQRETIYRWIYAAARLGDTVAAIHKIREELLRNGAERLNKRLRKCLYYQITLKFLTRQSPVHLQLECTGGCGGQDVRCICQEHACPCSATR